MKPEQYLAKAIEHYEAGRFEAAMAASAIASAASSITASAPQPAPAIYRGDHKISKPAWCGICYSPRKRYRAGSNKRAEPCTCRGNDQRVRQCRYCSTDLELNAETRQWVDSQGKVGCPKAPDPNDLSAVPDEPDLNRDTEWHEFLQTLSGDEFTAADIIRRSREFTTVIPVTKFGDVPHPRQLDSWLRARAGQAHEHYVVRPAGGTPEAPRWRSVCTLPPKGKTGQGAV